MCGLEWAAGDAFTLADCAAAPALFYADWAHPIGKEHLKVLAYPRPLLVRPAVSPPPVLRRLAAPDRQGTPEGARLPATAARASLLRPRRGRSSALPAALSARCARPRLNLRSIGGTARRAASVVRD